MPGSFGVEELDSEEQRITASAEPQMAAREQLALVDYRPRTTLPPSSYLHKRQVALSLGVEALGTWSGATGGGARPLAYGRHLAEMMVPTN
jgi:hypothetical protein